ncbi:hypothetical protein CYY_000578 [Polysphondylium violaceum]|uniref:RING-type domain-containing protein n=1 Tax=Polysphondylium violaceum TaxID=133409 RepID=A0A8J4V8S9_9MYCE|nr:hypothetical protein CYY_000578 [Polysphondylium violaceum]
MHQESIKIHQQQGDQSSLSPSTPNHVNNKISYSDAPDISSSLTRNDEQQVDNFTNDNPISSINLISTPTIKKGRGRPRKNPLPESMGAVVNNSNGGTLVLPKIPKTKQSNSLKKSSNSNSNSISNSSSLSNSGVVGSIERVKQDDFLCPLCNLYVCLENIEQHFALEVQQMDSNTDELVQEQFSIRNSNRVRREATKTILGQSLEKTNGVNGNNATEKDQLKSMRDTLSTIRSNREKRSRTTSSSVAMMQTASMTSQTCFICHQIVHGDLDFINQHINQCLERQEQDQQDDEDDYSPSASPSTSNKRKGRKKKAKDTNTINYSDLPPGAEIIEYAGIPRIRTSSLLDEDMKDIFYNRPSRKEEQKDVDYDLNIEEDDTIKYGDVQYTEADLKKYIKNNDSDNNDTSSNGHSSLPLPTFTPPTPTTTTTTTTITTTTTTASPLPKSSATAPTTNVNNIQNSINSNAFLIESLKEKLKDQEVLLRNIPNCLVCLCSYKIPVASIQCWHVHCEECWLNTLAFKKLCPQCNIITTPQDLRKIYL